MTRCYYYETNKITFDKVVKDFNRQNKTRDFDEFLNLPMFKYSVGDIVVLDLNEETMEKDWKNNVVFRISDRSSKEYVVRFLTPTAHGEIGMERFFEIDFLERNSHLY